MFIVSLNILPLGWWWTFKAETCRYEKILIFLLCQLCYLLLFVQFISIHNGTYINLQQYASILTTERWVHWRHQITVSSPVYKVERGVKYLTPTVWKFKCNKL